MNDRTHLNIDRRVCGEPISLGEDRAGLAANIDHPDTAPLRADEYRRDVASAEREQEAHTVLGQHSSYSISSIHGFFQ